MKSSIKFCYNRQRVGGDGMATIYMRVLINRQKKDLPLDVRWPVKYFDFKRGACKPRFDGDQECEDNNIIIRTELTKSNEVLRYYRLADIPISLSRFLRDYNNNLSKSDFVAYMESKIKHRHVTREISAETYIKHEAVLRKLKAYKTEILFVDFDENWCQDFDSWLIRTGKPKKKEDKQLSQNTRWSYHKVIKTYMNLATRDHIKFNFPYMWFSLSQVKGNWKAIFEKEVKRLYDYYQNEKCRDNHKHILRAFLFSCMTGLRISDLKRITKQNVMDGILVFLPHKTRKSNVIQKVPLNKMAKQLFDDAVAYSLKDQIFNNFAEQYANRTLKDIATLLEIEENLHWHVGRHTFISLYYSKTKDLVAAQEFAGHKNIRQTRVYTHLNPAEIKDLMKPMDDII